MSTGKSHEVNDVISRIKIAYGFKSDAALADFLGVKPNTIATWKIRKYIDWNLIIAKCDDVSASWLLTGEGSKDNLDLGQGSQGIPINETPPDAPCGKVMNVFVLAGAGSPKDLTEHEPITTISVPEDFYSASIVPVKIRGRSMEPIIHDGAFIGVDRADRQVVSGEIYAVWMPHEGAIVKRLFMELDKVIIQSDNKDFRPFSVSFKELENGAYGDDFILGRVKWVIQRL